MTTKHILSGKRAEWNVHTTTLQKKKNHKDEQEEAKMKSSFHFIYFLLSFLVSSLDIHSSRPVCICASIFLSWFSDEHEMKAKKMWCLWNVLSCLHACQSWVPLMDFNVPESFIYSRRFSSENTWNEKVVLWINGIIPVD